MWNKLNHIFGESYMENEASCLTKCPECEKGNSDVYWKPWMGDLKDHLLGHYRLNYFIKYVSRQISSLAYLRDISVVKKLQNIYNL